MRVDTDYTELLMSSWFENKKNILLLYIAMQHPHLWKYFYFEMVKVQSSIPGWDSMMEEAYKFSELYNTTPRTDKAFLPTGSMDKMTLLTNATHLSATLKKSYISGCFDREGQNERLTIQKAVEDFVQHITKQVEKRNKYLAAAPIFSGSVAEGTKVGLFDEYDFILHLQEQQHVFDKNEETVEYLSFLGTGFDASALFKDYIGAFANAVEAYDQHMKHFNVLKHPFHTTKVKPFTITLLWNGNFFKNLKINIDFVPALKISYQNAQKRLPHLSKECAKSQIFAVCKQNQFRGEYLRMSYSIHERDLLQALPMYIKNDYCLAKAVRHTEVCPNVQLSDGTCVCVNEYVTTYMLKTCLLHTVKECRQNHMDENEWLSLLSIKWAIKIYEQMKFFLEIFEGKIPHYFESSENVSFHHKMSYHLSDTEQQYYNKRQRITLTFIDCILQLLQELLKQRLQVRCLIQ